jgi:hypothetical protein
LRWHARAAARRTTAAARWENDGAMVAAAIVACVC